MEVQETNGVMEAADRIAEVGARLSPQKRAYDQWLPRKVRVAAFEQNGTRLIIANYVWESGIVTDAHWNKAIDLGNATPIRISEDGRESVGFLADADKGVGIIYKRDQDLSSLTTTAELAWAMIDSRKLVDAFTVDPSFRTKIMWLLMGAVPFMLLMWLERM